MKKPRRTISVSNEAHARFTAAAAARGIRVGTLVNLALAEPLEIADVRVLIEAPKLAHRAECLHRKIGIPVSKLVDDAINAAIDSEVSLAR